MHRVANAVFQRLERHAALVVGGDKGWGGKTFGGAFFLDAHFGATPRI